MESGQSPPYLAGREATHLGKFADRELHGFTHGVGAKYVENEVAAKRHTSEHVRPTGIAVAGVPWGRRPWAVDFAGRWCYAVIRQIRLLAGFAFLGPSFGQSHPARPG